MIRTSLFSASQRDKEEWTYWVYLGVQPWYRYVWYEIYDKFTIWQYHQPLKWLTMAVDNVDYWWHRRKCHDNCGTGYRHADSTTIEMCVHTPRSIKRELHAYSLGEKQLKRVGRFEITRAQYDSLSKYGK